MALQSSPIKGMFKLRQQIDQRNIENKVWYCGSIKRTFKARYNAVAWFKVHLDQGKIHLL